MDFFSLLPIRTSDPAPEVKRTFSPREAYAEFKNALEYDVSSPSTNTFSVPYTESVSA